jgi:pimeloyl-ACP methyl ester carboxylesterase
VTTLLLHPIGLSADCWRFTEVPDAVALDIAGFGSQPLPSDGLDLDAIADDLVARAPAGTLDVVGVSLGGMAALHMGLRHPDRVRSLVVACASAAGNPAVMQQRAEAIRSNGWPAQIPETISRWFTADAVAEDRPYVRYAREQLATVDARAMEAGWLAIGGHNVADRLAELRLPVTVIAGERDQGAPVAALRQIHEGVPGSRLVVLDGPHMLHMQAADAFRTATRAHLDWVAGQ